MTIAQWPKKNHIRGEIITCDKDWKKLKSWLEQDLKFIYTFYFCSQKYLVETLSQAFISISGIKTTIMAIRCSLVLFIAVWELNIQDTIRKFLAKAA